jgi:hypothetical protein
MADHEPMMDVACSDPELSEELREALALLRDLSDNDEFRTLVDDVLAGRCTLTEASGTAAFSNVVFGRVARDFDDYVGHLTKDEKQGLTAQAESSDEAASCGAPCAGCPGMCALRGSAGSVDPAGEEAAVPQ